MLVLIVHVSLVLLVHERCRLLLHSIVNDPSQLFLPNFLTLNVKEVLDVLNSSLETRELLFYKLKLRFEGLNVTKLAS